MSWGETPNSNKFKQSYIQGFLDISAGNVIVQRASKIQVKSNTGDGSVTALQIGSTGFDIFAGQSSTFMNYDTFAGLSTIGVSYENTVTDISNRLQFIGSSTISGNKTLIGVSGGSDLEVFGTLSTKSNGHLFINGDASFNKNVYVTKDLSVNQSLFVTNRSVFNGDVSMSQNLSLTSATQNRSISINKGISSEFALDVSGATLFRSKVSTVADVSINGKLSVSDDVSLNKNLTVTGTSRFGAPPATTAGYEVDINGQMRIYEATGSNITGNTSVATLTLEHGNNAGSSSIMFTSPSTTSNGDYAYIKYQDNSGATTNTGLLTIGIENDPMATATADKISLYAAGGSGYVGVNTLTPTFNLDVSGTANITNTLIVNKIDVSNVASQMDIATTQTSGVLNIGTADRSGAINIGTGTTGAKTIQIGSNAANSTTELRGQTINLGTSSTSSSININPTLTGTLNLGTTISGGTISLGPTVATSGSTFNIARGDLSGGTINAFSGNATNTSVLNIATGTRDSGSTINIATNDTTSQETLNIGTGTNRIGTINIGTGTTGTKTMGIGGITTQMNISGSIMNINSTGVLTINNSQAVAANLITGAKAANVNIATGAFTTSSGILNIMTGANDSTSILNIANNDTAAGNVKIASGTTSTQTITIGKTEAIKIVNLAGAATTVDISAAGALTLRGSSIITQSDVSMNSKLFVGGDVSMNSKLFVGGDVSLNKNLAVASTVKIGAPPTTQVGYELDISGQMRIYELTGSDVTTNTSVATLTLEHGNANGTSSIMFTSPSTTSNGDYAYIKYQDNSGATTNTGVLTIGIENDPTATATADKISLYAAGGSGYVGVNTQTPTFNLDVSGTTNISSTLTVNKIDVSNVASQMDIGTTQTSGILNIGTDGTRTGTIKIGNATNTNTIGNFDISGNSIRLKSGMAVFSSLNTSGDIRFAENMTAGTHQYSHNQSSGTLQIASSTRTSGSIEIGNGDNNVNHTMNIGNGTSNAGVLRIATGASSTGTTTIGRGDAIKIVNGTSTTIDISAVGALSLRGSSISFNGSTSFSNDMALSQNVKLGSGTNSVAINKDISSQFALDVSGITNLRAPLYTLADVSIQGKLFTTEDVSFNKNAYIGNDLSVNRFLYVKNRSLFDGDVSLSQNLSLTSATRNNSVAINKDISSSFALDVSGITMMRSPLYTFADVSIQGKLFATEDVSFNKNAYIGNDLSVNRFLYVQNKSLFNGDVSLSQNLSLTSTTRNNSVAINKDISSSLALDVSGITMMRAPLYTLADVSIQGKLFTTEDVSFNKNVYIGNDLSVNRFLYVKNRSLFEGDVSMNQNLSLTSATQNRSISINKGISSEFALDVSGATLFRTKVSTVADVSINGKLSISDDVSLNKNLTVANTVKIGAPPATTAGYELDINGQVRIYEATGSDVTGNTSVATLTLEHGNDQGSSSIMFKSPATAINGDYAYIKYQDLSAGTASVGLLTIGIENDATGTLGDKISLYTASGKGCIGVNTQTPQTSLDVSGQMRIYEGTGTAASDISGTLILEHANAGGTSSLVFKGANSVTKDYAYVQYQDNTTDSVSSIYKWDLSTNVPTTWSNTATFASTGKASNTLKIQPSDSSLNWLLTPGTKPSGFSPAYCISFNQTNVFDASTTRINYLETDVSYSSTFSLSLWFYPTLVSLTNRYITVASLSQGVAGYSAEIAIDGNTQNLTLLANNLGTAIMQTGNSSVIVNTWHHLVFTHNSVTRESKLFLNNSLGASTTSTAINTYNWLTIGMRFGQTTGSAAKGFRGGLCYVNLFNNELSQSDVSQLYVKSAYTPTSTEDRGLLTIGIENESGYVNNDRIALWPGAGQGLVGINTQNPQATLDVSGNANVSSILNVSNTLTVNKIEPTVINGQMDIATTQTGVLNIGTGVRSGGTGAVNINTNGSSSASTTIGGGSINISGSGDLTLNTSYSGTINIVTSNRTSGTFNLGSGTTSNSTINAFSGNASNTSILNIATGTRDASSTINIANNTSSAETLSIGTGANRTGTINIGTGNTGTKTVSIGGTNTSVTMFNQTISISSVAVAYISGASVRIKDTGDGTFYAGRLPGDNTVDSIQVALASGVQTNGSVRIMDGSGSTGTITIGRGDAIKIVNGTATTVDISAAGALSLRGSSISFNGSTAFSNDMSLNQNVKLGSGNNSVAINKGISSEFALDVSGATLFRTKVSTVADVSINGKLSISDDVSLNKNLTVANTVKIGAPPTSTAGYELDINGQMRIYEATGSDVTGNTSVATLTLEHGNDQGSSSIMFKSQTTGTNGDYAYIKYQDLSAGAATVGVLTIGIENDPMGATLDRISLYAAAGKGYVGVNTLTPTFNLDVSGTTNISSTLTVNKIDASNATSQMDIATTQSGGALNIGTLTTRSGAINIGTGTTSKTIDVGSTSAGTTTIKGGTTLIQAGSILELGNGIGAATITLGRDITTNGSIGIASATSSTGGTVNVANGSSSQITTNIGRGNAIRIVNGTATTVDISAAGALSLRGSSISFNGSTAFSNDMSLNQNVKLGSGNNSVAINKDISMQFALDVSGDMNVSGKITAGSTIALPNNSNNKKLVLYDNSAGENPASATSFYGFGINTSTLRYQASTAGDTHKFFSGTSNGVLEAGSLKLLNTTVATNSTSGALIVDGGVGIAQNLIVAKDVSLNQNLAVTGTSRFGAPPATTAGYKLDISGQMRIYEGTGSNVTSNTSVATLTLQHGDANGISSIMFTSPSTTSNSDYAYIKYQDGSGATTNTGLLTIGIENDPTAAATADKISLYAAGGLGYVGVNTLIPTFNLDVSGTTNISNTLTVNKIDASNAASQMDIATTQTSGVLNIGTADRSGAINIGTGTTGAKTIQIGSNAANSTTELRGQTINLGTSSTSSSININPTLTGTLNIGTTISGGTISLGPTVATSASTFNIARGDLSGGTINAFSGNASNTSVLNIATGTRDSTSTINIATNDTTSQETLNIGTGTARTGTINIGTGTTGTKTMGIGGITTQMNISGSIMNINSTGVLTINNSQAVAANLITGAKAANVNIATGAFTTSSGILNIMTGANESASILNIANNDTAAGNVKIASGTTSTQTITIGKTEAIKIVNLAGAAATTVDISAGGALTLRGSSIITQSDVSMNSKLFVRGDVSLNQNLAVTGTSRFGAPPASTAGYEFDINGQTRLYEGTGSDVTTNTSVATLTLEHGNASGTSSIMFTSPSTTSNGDYAYIKYQDGSGATTNTGVLTIGIENDPTATATADKISLYAAGGSGYVGVNTQTPTFNLDVSGTTNISSTLTVNKIEPTAINTQMDIATTQTSGVLNIGTDAARTGTIKIGNTSNTNTIGNFDISGSRIQVKSGTAVFSSLNTSGDIRFAENMTSGTHQYSHNQSSGTLQFASSTRDSGSIEIGNGNNNANHTMNIGNGTSNAGALKIATGASSTGTTTIGRGDAIKIVNGTSTTVDISAAGALTLRGSSISFNGSTSFSNDMSLNRNVKLGSGTNSVAINKDISSQFALDVSGDMNVSGKITAGSTIALPNNSNNKKLVLYDNSAGEDPASATSFYGFGINTSTLRYQASTAGDTHKFFSGTSNGVIEAGSLKLLDTTASTNSTSGALIVSGGVGIAQNLIVAKDVSLNQNLAVTGTSRFGAPPASAAGYEFDINGQTRIYEAIGSNVTTSTSVATLTLEHGDASGCSSIMFTSPSTTSNGDYAYIKYQDLSGATTNTGLLTIGIENDPTAAATADKISLYAAGGTGYVGVNTLTPSYNLDVNGTFRVSGATTAAAITATSLSTGTITTSGTANLYATTSTTTLNMGTSVPATSTINIGNLTDTVNTTLKIGGNIKLGSGSKYVTVNKDPSLNFFFDVSGDSLFRNNLTINAPTRNNSVAINKDISSQYALDVSGESLFRNNLTINTDLSVNQSFFVTNRSLFAGDVSMNQNLSLTSALRNRSVAINKDISSAFALDVSGNSLFRGTVNTTGTIAVTNGGSINVTGGGTILIDGAQVVGGSAGTTLTTNGVKIGNDTNYYVSVNKPNFYNDPSLTIYYSFDTSINNGTQVQNLAKPGTYDGSLNNNGVLGTGMIDTSIRKYGTASLKNDKAVNNGMKILSATPIPVTNTMSFSVWVNYTLAPTTRYRIFEFSDYSLTGQTPESNTIALDISGNGVVYPVLTSGSATCFTTLTAPIVPYTLTNTGWNHIVWTITPTTSYIYVNAAIPQVDNITTPVPNSDRANANIAYPYVSTTNYEYPGNLDEFRWYTDKVLNEAEIYQLNTNNFYTLDISGGFLANGASVIYEPSGSKVSYNSGTLTLLHGDPSGSSSILFKSVNDPLEYGYIQYEENSAGSTGYHFGLMTIGIENDAGAGAYTTQADRISLFPSGGSGFVGVNTKTPQTTLDVSGVTTLRGKLNTIADVSINGRLFTSLDVSFNQNAYVNQDLSVDRSLFVTNRSLFSGDVSFNQNISLTSASQNRSLAINKDISSQYALDVSGQIRIYEGIGTVASATAGSLVLEHGDASGCSSILFRSKNNGTSDYAYIQYQENFNTTNFQPTNPAESGLLTIGIENDSGNGTSSDRISLWSSNGNGRVGVNTKNPQQALDVSGQVQAFSFNATSDYRAKDEVVPLNTSFNVDSLNPVTYKFKATGRQDIGFIAHEVQEFYPFLVNGEKDGPNNQSLNYNGFIGILTKEIQDLKKKVSDQDARALAQEARALAQDARIQALEKMVFNK